MLKKPGKYISTFIIPSHIFDSGNYNIEIMAYGFGNTKLIKTAINLSFAIQYITKEVSLYTKKGLIKPNIKWHEEKIL